MKAITIILLTVALFTTVAFAEDMTIPERKVDASKLTCKELMGANDSDRQSTVSFYHGYLAGQKNNPVVDLNAASDLSDKVKDYCLSNPTSTVMDAFSKAAK